MGRVLPVLGALLLASCGGADEPPQRQTLEQNVVAPSAGTPSAPQPADELRDYFEAPKFTLTDQTGAPFGTADLQDRVWVANFIFTHCLATCPAQTRRMAELQRRIARWPDADRVRLISITVDPARDTVEQLKTYADKHGADPQRWKFLTGGRDELWRISKEGFKLPVSESARDTANPFTHSSRFVLVGARGRVRGFYDGASADELETLVTDLRKALEAPPADGQTPAHLAVPADLFDSPWLETRRAAQIARAGEVPVRRDFQFVDRVEECGIAFVSHAVPDAGKDFKRNHYDHANGLAVADVDGDGLSDVYFVTQVGGNQLWRNQGSGRFEDITERAGVSVPDRVSVTASFADTDNDGDPDLFVTTTFQGNLFFENDGNGNFRNVTREAGLELVAHSSGADFFDYDNDGLLDLFVSNVGVFTTNTVSFTDPNRREGRYRVGMDESFAGHLFPDRFEQSVLYRNEGGNRFRNVTQEAGLTGKSWTGDATPIDGNDDGWTDLYVLNMQGRDLYYENLRGQGFRLRGRDVFPRHVWGGMSAKSLDFNNDGRMDLFVVNMHADMWELKLNRDVSREKQKPPPGAIPTSYTQTTDQENNIFGNALFVNGGGTFRDRSDEVNAETYWPWGLSVGDLNADGHPDAFVTSCMNYPFRYHVNSLLLCDGKRFWDAEFLLGVEPRAGGRTAAPWFELDCSGADKDCELCQNRTGKSVVWGALGSRSSVLFDLDGDGDLDIVTNDFHTRPMVLVSDLAERGRLNFLKVRLEGTTSNRDGLGARVTLRAGGRDFTQVHDGQSGYLSQSSLPLYFGLGDATAVDRLTIRWPGGAEQVVPGPIEANRLVTVEQADAAN